MVDADPATSTAVGSYAGAITASGLTSANYTISYVAGNLSVTPAPLTVTATGESMTYGGSVPSLTYTYSGLVNGDTSASFMGSLGGATSSSPVGVYPITQGTLAATGNYTIGTFNAGTLTVNQASSTTTVSDAGGTYDGTTAFAATSMVTGAGTITGAATLDYYDVTTSTDMGTTAPINAGNYKVTATYAGDTNHTGSSDSVNFTINKANATITITLYSVTYDGNTHTATGTATGVGGINLPGGDLTLSGTAHTNAGTYAADSWSFHDPNGNYADAGATVTDSIAKANASFTLTPYNVTYDGNSHTATGTATGVGGVTLPSGDMNMSGTTHTNAGTYATDAWSFADASGNYNIASGTASDSIAKANATFTITLYSVTYDGNPHTATYSTITGVNGQTGSTVGTVNVSNTTHTNAGTYASDSWSFTGTANYNNIASTTITDTINKANATVVVTPYTVTYNGKPQTATVTSITGVNGETGATVGTVNVSNTTHTNAGTYSSDSWSFTGTANYNNIGTTTITDTINKASASITVTPYNVPYNANSHTATGTATGVGGVNLSSELKLSGTTHTSPGTYATDPWTFTDTSGNYNNASGTVTDIISLATLTITANNDSKAFGNSKTFNSTAFTETGLLPGDTITGVTETSTGAPASAPTGTYPIVPSSATGSGLSHYSITYVNGTLTVGQSIIVLDPKASGALTLSGSGSISVAGVVYVDSSSSSALSASGTAQVTALAIDVVGGVKKSGSPTFNPAPSTGVASLADPLSGLSLPSTSGQTNYGSFTLSGSSSKTISPGIYSQISVTGSGTLTMSAGVYIIEGGGFTVSGTGKITGSGVMIFNAGSKYPKTGGTYGSISLGGSETYSLSPATSGTYTGITFFQPSDNTQSLNVSANASGISGTIYAPTALVSVGNGGNLNVAMVVDELSISKGGTADVMTAGQGVSGVASLTATTADLPVAVAPTTSASSTNLSTGLTALDFVLADAGTASAVTSIAASSPVVQTAAVGSTVNVITTSIPPAIDPAALDALLLEGLSVRSSGVVADRLAKPMKWSL